MISIFNQYISVKTIFLLCLESVAIVISVLVEAHVHFWNQQPHLFQAESFFYLPLNVLTVFALVQGCRYLKLNTEHSPSEEVIRFAQTLGAGYILMCALYCFFPKVLLGPGMLFVVLTSAVAAICGLRAGFDRLWRVFTRAENVLILGDGPTAVATAREVERRSDLKLSLVGLLNPGNPAGDEMCGYSLFGGTNTLRSLVNERRVSRIIIALDDWRNVLPVRELLGLRIRGVEVVDAQSALAALTGRIWLQPVEPSWFVFATGFRHSRRTRLIKRSMDLVLGILGLVLFCPLMCLAAVAIWIDSPGSIFYRQIRVGQGGKCFELFKFRSMQRDAEAENGPQWAQKGDPRMTRVGQLLRRYRLDELPQLFNVIRGEMSLVGPRPERPIFVEQLRDLIPFYDERHSVRPGITGWAQVQYSYGASVEDAVRKLEYDLFYLRSLSNLFDVAIIFRTIRVVLVGHGW